MTSSRPVDPHTPGMAMPRDRNVQPGVTVRCWICGNDMEGYDHICAECQDDLCKPKLGERLYRERGGVGEREG